MSRVYPISMASTVAIAALAPARKVMMRGEAALSLTMQLAARAACRQKRVLFISGDNRFDPFRVARYAKSAGVRAEDVLRSILIARAFTAYQLAELVARLDPDPAGDFVVISGPCSTFLDDDVPLVDAARLFYRALWKVMELARGGITMLLAQSRVVTDSRRAYFLTDLCRASDVVMHLSGQASFTIERHGASGGRRLPGYEECGMQNAESERTG